MQKVFRCGLTSQSHSVARIIGKRPVSSVTSDNQQNAAVSSETAHPQASQGVVRHDDTSERPSPLKTNVSGLKWRDLEVGRGRVIQEYVTVDCEYTIFVERTGELKEKTKKPVCVVVRAGRIMRGMEEGIEGMREGGVRQLYVPTHLAYGGSLGPNNMNLEPYTSLMIVLKADCMRPVSFASSYDFFIAEKRRRGLTAVETRSSMVLKDKPLD
eukprot:Platyproteum_vivax@DN1685_c0_g1_i1.p1